MSEPTHYKQKQEKSGDTIAENKHRKEEKQKTIFSFPQKIFAKREKKGWGRLTACIAGHAIQRKNPQDESQRFSKVAATYSPTTQCSTIGDAELNDPVRNGKGWDLSAITT